jgi:23S rRNA pseudouridine2457 synthase
MPLILLNKPYLTVCQFSPHPVRTTLAQHVSVPGVYPVGRLDTDSEGLVLLTDNGRLQHAISHPDSKQAKIYMVQVEGEVAEDALIRLREPLDLGDFVTQSCQAVRIEPPQWLWQRTPPVRSRAYIPTTWLALTLSEGKNRQVRRMTAAVGLPTLRLVRIAIGPYSLEKYPLWPGEWTELPDRLTPS